MTDTRADFPIMDGVSIKKIPWGLIEPHEKQALTNHDQTLKRLAERGGLSSVEAWLVLTGRPLRRFKEFKETECEDYLRERVCRYYHA